MTTPFFVTPALVCSGLIAVTCIGGFLLAVRFDIDVHIWRRRVRSAEASIIVFVVLLLAAAIAQLLGIGI